MRLNTELRDFLLAHFVDPERGVVADLLSIEPEPKHIACRANGYLPGQTVADDVLVVTKDSIGYGWPPRPETTRWKR